MEALRRQEDIAARALEFSILTATRSGEVRNATWNEIDQETKTWIIPAEHMKTRKEPSRHTSARFGVRPDPRAEPSSSSARYASHLHPSFSMLLSSFA
jgi:integrase